MKPTTKALTEIPQHDWHQCEHEDPLRCLEHVRALARAALKEAV